MYRKFCSYIWPIKSYELSRFLCITLLMFCILGIQNLIRALKDSVVTTMIGPETTTFLKLYLVMPSAFLFSAVYIKIISKVDSESLFYYIFLSFIAFFALFAFVLFPNHDAFSFSQESFANIVAAHPHLKWFVLLIGNWGLSLFYVISELWSNIVFALLFWQFVNRITNVEQSKRFYPLFTLLGQTGLYLSGEFLQRLDKLSQALVSHNLAVHIEEASVKIVLSVVLVLGLISLLSFRYITTKILSEKERAMAKNLSAKTHPKFMDSLKLIFSSKYITLITLLLICYGVVINLAEMPWKATVSKVYKTPTEYLMFVGHYLSWTGILIILFSILGSNLVRKIGWMSAAMVTPVMVISTGLVYFIAVNFNITPILNTLGVACSDPLMLAVQIGALQNVLSKSSKYTLFDSTKEMAYVPLDPELKSKGKASADLIGTKLGKSMSSLLQSTIFILFPAATYESVTQYLLYIFAVIAIVWLYTVYSLNGEYKKAIAVSKN
ncbi:Npt1/Npt2 family nucleotide transporter [Candidatus Sarmatiella mevalonica]|uniref:Npt1/Npt2 family nucleotide transporter n=1 Tax=Candidatus Sarmatiella mevalonica TaxID=2770581 RepID=UPI001921B314|nr:Npt1/Npt2 family nucleotide transporter [Candidatus Sarmatiella mevalonica]